MSDLGGEVAEVIGAATKAPKLEGKGICMKHVGKVMGVSGYSEGCTFGAACHFEHISKVQHPKLCQETVEWMASGGAAM
jgi:hypothetical protein